MHSLCASRPEWLAVLSPDQAEVVLLRVVVLDRATTEAAVAHVA